MAAALQRGAAAFEPWLSHAGRVRGEGRDARRNERPSDGAERCGTWGLRAPPRRTTASQGANQGSNRGGRLKLNVVRRLWAGHKCGPARQYKDGVTRRATHILTRRPQVTNRKYAFSPKKGDSGTQVGDNGNDDIEPRRFQGLFDFGLGAREHQFPAFFPERLGGQHQSSHSHGAQKVYICEVD